MFYAKDHKTRNIFDPFSFLGEKRLNLLKNSWAGLFREEVLPYLPVHLLSNHFSQTMGRPTKELHAMMGAMILQQMKNLTDEETVRQFSFNIEWHYALGITEQSDAATYLSTKTVWNMRALMSKHALEGAIFDAISSRLVKVAGVDTDTQRLDSTHIFSNMKHLGRISLFVKTMKGFLTNLKRHHKALYAALDDELIQHYMSKRGESAFSMVKPSEASHRLEDLGKDLFALVAQFKDDDQVASMSSYQKLVRLMHEQCIVPEEGNTEAAIEVKADKDVASDSMQNPSDPDAGYDGHKGQGYQSQLMETYSEDESAPCLITHVAVEPAHAHDSHALMPAIEETTEKGLAPKTVLADSLYGSDENVQNAAAQGVEVVSPVLGRNRDEGKLRLDDFFIGEDGMMQSCPAGHDPERVVRNRKKDGYIAVFSSETCSGCPLKASCPSKHSKSGHRMRYTDKQVRLARRRAYEQTDAFKERYRWRAGVEGTNSIGKQTTGLDRLRVRGMQAVRFAVTMKWLGVNIMRVSKWMIAQNRDDSSCIALQYALKWWIWACIARAERNIRLFFVWLVFLGKSTCNHQESLG